MAETGAEEVACGAKDCATACSAEFSERADM
jgi:hypothetical protein